MKRYVLVIVVLFAALGVVTQTGYANEKLFKYVPEHSSFIMEIKADKFAQLPLVLKLVEDNLAKDSEYGTFKAELKKFDIAIEDLATSWIIFAGNKKTADATIFEQGILVETNVPEEKMVEMLQGSYFRQNSELKVDKSKGRNIYRIVPALDIPIDTTMMFELPKLPIGEGIFFTYLESDVIFLSEKSERVKSLVENPSGKIDIVDKIPSVNRDALAWGAFELPEDGANLKGMEGITSAAFALDFQGNSNEDMKMNIMLGYKQEQLATMHAMQFQGITMMMSGIAFPENPQLGLELSKAITFTPEGKSLTLQLFMPKALCDKLISYVKQHVEQAPIQEDNSTDNNSSELDK